MRTQRNYIRPLRHWEALASGLDDAAVAFQRTVYDADKNFRHKETERLDFSRTDVSEHIRLCFSAYIVLGKLSPADAQSVINEYEIYSRAAVDGAPAQSFRDFLSRVSKELPGVFDDPMQGVFTRPFHEGLFDNRNLLDALDVVLPAVALLDGNAVHPLRLYFETYTKCRQRLLDMAFSMARTFPSLREDEIHSGEEFFTWWRRRWDREIRIALPDQTISLLLPSVPEKTLATLTKIIQNVTDDYATLARLLGRPADAVTKFVHAFVTELNEGMVNLPLNQLGQERCPVAKDLETSIKSSAGYPTTSPFIKEVNISGRVLEDAFKRFFAVKQKKFLLPRTQKQVCVSQLGGCPFPDYGFVERAKTHTGHG